MPGKKAFKTFTIVILALALVAVTAWLFTGGLRFGRFVFLDRHTDITTKIVSGSDPWPQPIASSPYSYDESAGKIWLLDPVYFYERYIGLKVLYGETAMARGDSDAGGHIEVDYVHDLPQGEGDMQITGVDSDGTVHFTFQNKDVKLKPGENWTGEPHYSTVTAPGSRGSVLVNLTEVDTFTNYGLFDIIRVEG